MTSPCRLLGQKEQRYVPDSLPCSMAPLGDGVKTERLKCPGTRFSVQKKKGGGGGWEKKKKKKRFSVHLCHCSRNMSQQELFHSRALRHKDEPEQFQRWSDPTSPGSCSGLRDSDTTLRDKEEDFFFSGMGSRCSALASSGDHCLNQNQCWHVLMISFPSILFFFL